MNSLPPESWEECLERHGGNENEARAIFERYPKKNYQPDMRFIFAYDMLELRESGFPFDKNDLTIEQWYYLKWLKDAIIIFHTPKQKT
jgi:hypothetical protein